MWLYNQEEDPTGEKQKIEQDAEDNVQEYAKLCGHSLDTKSCSSKMIADRLADWIPVIVENHDWDWIYLIKLIEFKIKRMRSELVDFCENSDEIGAEMDETLKAIDEIYKEDNSVYMSNESVSKFCDSLKNLRHWWS